MNNSESQEQKKAQQVENERRVENLINLVENKTRTDRHLEQHSDIGDPNRLDHAREIQHVREEQIEDLKRTIAYGDNPKNDTQDQLNNLRENYTYSEGYLNENSDHMNKQDLQNLKEKQQNRKEQIDQME